jgi:hypothetical protein
MDSIIVIDDVISRGYQNFIEKMAKEFPWYFLDQVTNVDNKDTATGFSYEILRCRQKGEQYNKTPYTDALIPLLFEAIHKVDKNQDILEIFRIRAGMFVKNQNGELHTPHIDREDFHYTMLYYVNDSDGPTRFYDHKEGKVIKMVDPKKGRAVIMTGDRYHASSSPKNHSNRIVVNYNFLV